MKTDNHGQVFVLFLLLLPLFILFIAFIIEYGLLLIENQKIENTIKETITYSLESKEERSIIEVKAKELLMKNIKETEEIEIKFIENSITITVKKNKKSLFHSVFKKEKYSFDISLTGTIQDGVIKIKKDR